MVTVCEVSSNSNMPGSGSPVSCGTDSATTPPNGFITTYSYNLANLTTTVTQGAQTRTFQSDWLGRPISVTEPEASAPTTYSYAYNSTGLLVTRKRPKANQSSGSTLTTTTTQYDSVGRVISVTYDDGTPTKTFAYDVNQLSGSTLHNPKGRMVQQLSGTNAGSIYSYDPMGRAIWSNQCTPWKCGSGSGYTTSYAYDWVSDLLTLGNADGVTTSYNSYTPASEVGSITSSLSDSTHPGTLVSQIAYGPNGPLNYTLGNGLKTSFSYDSLGRKQGGWLCQGSSQNYCTGGTQIYGYYAVWTGARLTGLSDTVLSSGISFAYDDFGRLKSSALSYGTQPTFNYSYDRWGNRWAQTLTSGAGPQSSLSFNTTTNRISTTGFGYDAAGNLTSDTFHTYVYDAEGNVTQVDGGATAKYTYDALNRRIRIDQAGGGSEFVLNPNGQRVSIWNPGGGYETQGQTYWGSMPIEFSEAGAAHFQQEDYLGTERVRTTYNGSVEGSFLSLPFGDGFSQSGADNDPYHFATLDHDYSSNTDHSQYRQYSNEEGRWMSPDHYSGSYDITNPQSMNRYAYVLNNPLSFVDPLGLKLPDGGGGSTCANDPTCNGSLGPGGGGPGGGCSDASCGTGDPFGPCCGILGGFAAQEEAWWLASGSIPWYQVVNGNLQLLIAQNAWVPNPWWGGNITGIPDGNPAGSFGDVWLNEGAVISSGTGGQYPFLTSGTSGGGIVRNSTPHVAFAGSVALPIAPGIIFDIPFAQVPSTGTVCLGAGGGFGSPGVNVGLVYSSANIEDVLAGPSVSVSGQAGWWGGQWIHNTSGIAFGNSAGSPGVSVTATYSLCF